MKTNLLLPTHSGLLFTWTKNLGVAEESDLGPRWCARVFPDACDIGFRVRSSRTRKVLTFVHVKDRKDDEGELVARIFQALENPEIEVHVLND